MRVTFIMLALAGIGLSMAEESSADAQNLSCITEESPIERRVIRDCEKDYPVYFGPVAEEAPIPPPQPPPPAFLHDGGRKADGPNRDREGRSGGGPSVRAGGTAGGAPN